MSYTPSDDDLVSVLQKGIRRSDVDNAVLAAYEMYPTSPDVAQHLWTRLRIIAVEDVGMGLPLGPLLIETLQRDFDATPGGDWMMACHAVRLLATAQKDRTASEHADWVATMVELGWSAGRTRTRAVVGERCQGQLRARARGPSLPGRPDRPPS